MNDEKTTMAINIPKEVYKDLRVICHLLEMEPGEYIAESIREKNKSILNYVQYLISLN